MDLLLVVGGFAGLLIVLRLTQKTSSASPLPSPPVRSWDAVLVELRRNPDPDQIERILNRFTVDELQEIADELGVKFSVDLNQVPDDQLRTLMVLGIFRVLIQGDR